MTLAGTTIHISPDGKDDAPGAAGAPIRTLMRLQGLLSERVDITEVVFHEGVYQGSLTVPAPKGVDRAAAAKLPRLLLRTAEGETAVLDGARPVEEAEPVGGQRGIYVVTDVKPFRDESYRKRGLFPGMWDAKARRRYQLVADLRSVERFPASYCFTPEALYIHTSDGRPPVEHSIEVSRLDVSSYGLYLARPNVTVRGLRARNYHRSYNHSAGIAIRARNVTIEDCHSSNCPRGFSVYGPNARILRSRADDCGCGALVDSTDALVEDCVFIRIRDAFMVPMARQEDTGIEVYYPAGKSVVMRRNVCKGFTNCGIFIKCDPGEFLVENNTLINNTTGVGFSPSAGKNVVCRDNIIYGCRRGIARVDQVNVKLEAHGNCLWPSPWLSPDAMKSSVAYLNTIGEGNLLADPRLAAPEADEFRLLPDSPCIGRGSAGRNVGARGVVPKDFSDVLPPLVSLSEQPALASLTVGEGELPLFVATKRTFPFRIRAHDATGRPATMRIRIGDGEWSDEIAYEEHYTVRLPAESQTVPMTVRLADDRGNWGEPASIGVQVRLDRPALIGSPILRTNQYGVAISFQTNVECHGVGEYGLDKKYGSPLRVCGVEIQGKKGVATRFHVLGAVLPNPGANRRYNYRIRLETDKDEKGQEIEGDFELVGRAREYCVALDGEDAEAGGSAEKPWRTLQYAVDRALPGDRIVLRTGLYTGHTLITRGGTEGAPVAIEAEKRWTVVLDGHRRIRNLIRLVGAPHVEIAGLELRWYGDPYGQAVRIDRSPYVALRRCKIWNAFWHEGRAVGGAIHAADSPGFTMERNLIFRNDHALSPTRYPSSRIVYNTVRGHVHGGLYFNESVAGTALRNNCLVYNGNYVYIIRVADPKEMDTFNCDYNNIGTRLRHWRDEPDVVPNLPGSWGGSKTISLFVRKGGTWYGRGHLASHGTGAKSIVLGKLGTGEGWEGSGPTLRKWVPNTTTPPEKRGSPYWRPETFEDWQKFAGKDQHSTFADPRHHDLVEFDFHLDPNSPNVGAGENGTTIGAMGIHKQPPGEAR